MPSCKRSAAGTTRRLTVSAASWARLSSRSAQ
nr:MAG TPA: hypothetical protein [Caudoviricetes sp.]